MSWINEGKPSADYIAHSQLPLYEQMLYVEQASKSLDAFSDWKEMEKELRKIEYTSIVLDMITYRQFTIKGCYKLPDIIPDKEWFEYIKLEAEALCDCYYVMIAKTKERARILANLSSYSQEEFQKEIETFHKDVYKTPL